MGEGYSQNPDYLDKINWYFIPSASPDGYTYTFETDRMWRKTRSPQGGCIGVDPNRNWDFHWGESGVSDNPCTEVFPGDEAFSEIETRNIRDFVQTLEPTPILSHCFHSYSQLWLWPYGYDYDAYPENREELEQLMIGTRVFWDQGLLSLLNSETLADMASFCHQIRSSIQEKKYGLPWKLSLSSC